MSFPALNWCSYLGLIVAGLVWTMEINRDMISATVRSLERFDSTKIGMLSTAR